MLAAAIALAASLASTTTGGTWALAPLEGINVHPGHVAAAQAVLRGHVESLGQAVLVLDAGANPLSAAREKGASAVLRGTLTRLGQKVKVNLTLQPLDGVARSAGMDAASPEDLDPVLRRLARHLVKGEPLDDARVSEVTEQESDAYNRQRANSYFGLAVTGTPAESGSRSAFLAGLSLFWLYDARTFFADIQTGFSSGQGSSGGGFSFNVALLRPLWDRDVTPFVGGGLGYGSLDVEGPDGSGLQVFADVGAIFGRTRTVIVRGDVRPFLTTYRLTDATTSGSLAYGAQLSLGVGF